MKIQPYDKIYIKNLLEKKKAHTSFQNHFLKKFFEQTKCARLNPGMGRIALNGRWVYRQGLQSLTLFWAKVVHFATWFKTKDLIS